MKLDIFLFLSVVPVCVRINCFFVNETLLLCISSLAQKMDTLSFLHKILDWATSFSTLSIDFYLEISKIYHQNEPHCKKTCFGEFQPDLCIENKGSDQLPCKAQLICAFVLAYAKYLCDNKLPLQ